MNTKGNAIISVAVLVAVILIGALFYFQFQKSKLEINRAKETVTEKKEGVMESKILAQKNSSYSEFSQSKYEKAVKDGKIVYLEFYANWCPICRAQETDLIEGFNKLTREDVAGFRVNFKDDQTDEDEKALATKYKIPYQHHKIVLKSGEVVIDSAETWDSETLVSELSKL